MLIIKESRTDPGYGVSAMGLGVAALNVLASEDIFAGGDFVEDAFAFVPADENAVTKPIGILAAS